MIDWCGRNKLYTILWCGSNKSNGLHNKGSYHKGQYNVTFFALRDWAYKQISAWQPLLPSTKCLSFTFMYLLLCKSQFFFYSFLFFSFGKHHVVRKDLGTYVQLNMGNMSYYCWHHPWGDTLGGKTISPNLSMCPVETFCSCVCSEC